VSEIQGIGRIKFHEGKLEEFKHLSTQAMEIARTRDTGTLQYEVYLNDDQSEAICPRAISGLRGAGRARYAPWRAGAGHPCDGIRIQ
jgi:hypothetical protein